MAFDVTLLQCFEFSRFVAAPDHRRTASVGPAFVAERAVLLIPPDRRDPERSNQTVSFFLRFVDGFRELARFDFLASGEAQALPRPLFTDGLAAFALVERDALLLARGNVLHLSPLNARVGRRSLPGLLD
jgi:hypothetical protein